MAEAYSFLDVAFVHERIDLDTVRAMPSLKTVVIPLGPFKFQTSRFSQGEARLQLGLPREALIFLSFGHIRDGKNIDLFIRAMRSLPDVHLIIAGKLQSAGQRPPEFYKRLAREAGVESRVHWHVRHIAEAETGAYFDAADYLLLTYSKAFRSASAVLAAAAQFEKPVLASSGDGPLRTTVRKYRLGVFVAPDDVSATVAGVKELGDSPPQPNWAAYRSDHSWERNAEIVERALIHE
jgi:glycosyltransferase involved in cell wall biosynthesis